LVLGAVLLSAAARAEEDPGMARGVRAELGDDRFFRLLTWHQVWARYNEHNPGSLVRGAPSERGVDLGVRRSRMLMHGQLSKQLLVVTHLGINNQSTVGGGFGAADTPKKPQLFLHDIWGEFRASGRFAVGAGLHYWNGISRLTSASTLNSMTLDAPVFNWPTIDKTDQFARQMGVYFKGILAERLEYRAALNQPFATTGAPAEGVADFSATARTPAIQGYFKLDLLDIEANTLPYYVGTYLGKKRVFNVGTGFYWHPRSMALLERGARREVDARVISVDTFLDAPLRWRGAAVTAYLALAWQDLGPRYLRSVGLLNPSSALAEGALSSVNGPGNAVPSIGTGFHGYLHVGLLLPAIQRTQLQPYVALRGASLEALGSPVSVPDVGVNWYVAGHHAKLTLNLRNRPVFSQQPSGKPAQSGRLREVTMQGQIFF
jgi:hypothetical protein